MTTKLVDAIIRSMEEEPFEWKVKSVITGSCVDSHGDLTLYIEGRGVKVNINELRKWKLLLWWDRCFRGGPCPQIVKPCCPPLPRGDVRRLREAAEKCILWLKKSDKLTEMAASIGCKFNVVSDDPDQQKEADVHAKRMNDELLGQVPFW